MVSIQNATGRLIEIRAVAPFQREDLATASSTFHEISDKLRAPAVVCIDLRHAAVLDQASAAIVVELARSARLRVEREAIVLPSGNAILTMQQLRFAREAPSGALRHFHSPAEASAWLDEVLTPRERARLTVFLVHSQIDGLGDPERPRRTAER